MPDFRINSTGRKKINKKLSDLSEQIFNSHLSGPIRGADFTLNTIDRPTSQSEIRRGGTYRKYQQKLDSDPAEVGALLKIK